MKCLIVCAPRTRSTLFTATLGSHPDICALPEMNWAYGTIGEFLEECLSSPDKYFLIHGLIRSIARYKFGKENLSTSISALAHLMRHPDKNILYLMDELQELSGKKVLIEKSPSSSLVPTTYPECKYILLSRPDDLVKEGLKEMPNITNLMAEQDILEKSRNTLNYLRENREFLDVDAEEFVTNTEEVLRKVCNFLEIEYQEMKSENWDFAKRGVWFAEYGGDPIFMNNPVMWK